MILSLSLKNIHAPIVATTGIVEIRTDPTVADTYVNPKLSPRKYRKGSKAASIRNIIRSSFLILTNFFLTVRYVVKRIIEITRRKKTIVTGRNVSFAILNQMNENAQNSIARTTPPYVLILVFTGL
jgi:hypothetical protein